MSITIEVLSYDVRQDFWVERSLYVTDESQHHFTLPVNQLKRQESLT